jgi:hypothetical protein
VFLLDSENKKGTIRQDETVYDLIEAGAAPPTLDLISRITITNLPVSFVPV